MIKQRTYSFHQDIPRPLRQYNQIQHHPIHIKTNGHGYTVTAHKDVWNVLKSHGHI